MAAVNVYYILLFYEKSTLFLCDGFFLVLVFESLVKELSFVLTFCFVYRCLV